MKKCRQTEDVSASEYVIRRPLFYPVFLLIMFLMSLLVCFLDTPSTEVKNLSGVIAAGFYLISGFSIWVPVSVITFALLAMNFYIYFRFKFVIHEQSFSVTPLLGRLTMLPFLRSKKLHTQKGLVKRVIILT